MSNGFCFLKGLVDCSAGRIQDCNVKHVSHCALEEEQQSLGEKEQGFCFLKGMVDCEPGRIQDCNLKRVQSCMREE